MTPWIATQLDRRQFLAAAAAAVLLPHRPALATAPAGPAEPFSFDQLTDQARALAAREHQPPKSAAPAKVMQALDYDAWRAVRFKPEAALFAHGPGRFPVTFFPLGRHFSAPARIYVVTQEGAGQVARNVPYDAADFDIPARNPMQKLPHDVGFAGFKVQESRLGDQQRLKWQHKDWVAFLGASYFRAIGALYEYGVSARGIAIDTAVAGVQEEFPRFSRFYLAAPQDDGPTITVWALLEGPSVTGAFEFVMTRERDVLMDVTARIFLRRDVQRLGLAPLTSMYWFSETTKPTAVDWRPEVHDSDGLALWTGAGEYLWRPLVNPSQATVSAFADNAPRGFGLCQRDRNFDHYLDKVAYDRRPTVWVEPQGDWGAGTVQLVELPTLSEYEDNIVTMWVPQTPAHAGAQYDLTYRLHWVDREPFAPPLAHCTSTRLGVSPHELAPRQRYRRFAVAFRGGALDTLPLGQLPEAVITASRGQVQHILVQPVPSDLAGHWRVLFDWPEDGQGPVDLRLYLRLKDQPLTETWIYIYDSST